MSYESCSRRCDYARTSHFPLDFIPRLLKFALPFMKLLIVVVAVLGTGMMISGCSLSLFNKEKKEAPAPVGTPTPTPKPKPKATEVSMNVESSPEPGTWNEMPAASPTPAPVERNYRYGSKSDRDGFVRSPDAPDRGLIDVRGYPPGTEVRDPYTGNVFLVP